MESALRNQATLGITLSNLADLGKAYAPTPRGPAIAKRVKFGWSIKNKPPRFEMLSKHGLQVDRISYQRELSDNRAGAFASDFDWFSFGALLVVRRPDMTHFVVDGQHRHDAAMRRDDIDELPCLVYDIDNIEEEALGFVKVNSSGKHPTSVAKYKALVTAKDPTALKVQSLLKSSGYTAVDTTPKTGKFIKCVGVVIKLVEKMGDEKDVDELWGLIVSAHSDGVMNDRLIQGLEALYKDTNKLIAKDRYASRVKALGRDELLDGAVTAARAYKGGGARIWAQGILERVNLGFQKKNRIVFGTGGRLMGDTVEREA